MECEWIWQLVKYWLSRHFVKSGQKLCNEIKFTLVKISSSKSKELTNHLSFKFWLAYLIFMLNYKWTKLWLDIAAFPPPVETPTPIVYIFWCIITKPIYESARLYDMAMLDLDNQGGLRETGELVIREYLVIISTVTYT